MQRYNKLVQILMDQYRYPEDLVKWFEDYLFALQRLLGTADPNLQATQPLEVLSRFLGTILYHESTRVRLGTADEYTFTDVAARIQKFFDELMAGPPPESAPPPDVFRTPTQVDSTPDHREAAAMEVVFKLLGWVRHLFLVAGSEIDYNWAPGFHNRDVDRAYAYVFSRTYPIGRTTDRDLNWNFLIQMMRRMAFIETLTFRFNLANGLTLLAELYGNVHSQLELVEARRGDTETAVRDMHRPFKDALKNVVKHVRDSETYQWVMMSTPHIESAVPFDVRELIPPTLLDILVAYTGEADVGYVPRALPDVTFQKFMAVELAQIKEKQNN